MAIHLKTDDDLFRMRAAGQLTRSVLDMIGPFVTPGVTTGELDKICHDFIVNSLQAIPAPLNYRGFPKSICTSVNHVVCHGIPGDKRLKNGDIVNIDVTSIVDGFHGDTSRTFFVGEVSPELKKLVEVTWECLQRGIAQVKPGVRIREIGGAIQDYAESFGYGVVREYVGHGIGRIFHEEPQIPHYRSRGKNPRIRKGMTFTIEPMINLGTHETVLDADDGWTVRTLDNRHSAQFEHTVLCCDEGVEVLTDWKYIDQPV